MYFKVKIKQGIQYHITISNHNGGYRAAVLPVEEEDATRYPPDIYKYIIGPKQPHPGRPCIL